MKEFVSDPYGHDADCCAYAAFKAMQMRHPSIINGSGEFSPRMFANYALRNLCKPGEPEIVDVFLENAEWAFRWAHGGMPRVVMGHKHAASLMTTSMPAEYADTLRAPWRRFAVLVPSGLISDANVTLLVSAVDVSCENTTTGSVGAPVPGLRVLYFQPEVRGEFGGSHSNQRVTAAMGEFARPLAENEIENDHLARSLNLVMRLTIGVVLELQGKSASSSADGPVAPRMKRGEPKCWDVRLTRPIKNDVRDAVRSYLRGNGRPLNKQGIVCGHWKNQPHGPGGKDRKFIHIESYWRGPEDAPIVVKPHILGKDATP